jgi:hypothetical protein
MWRKLWIGMAAVAALGAALGAAPAAAEKPLFAAEAEISFTLTAPFERLVRQSRTSVDPVDGTISVDGGPAVPLKIAPRGFTRRTGGLCTFPPLKLDLDKPAMKDTLFEGQNKLKLVTQCRPQASYEQYLIREYTVYRLYNLITPESFRVRPARVTYRDTEGRRGEQTRFAFLIEDGDDVAKRNGVKELDFAPRELASAQIGDAALARFALFQLVIGNLDWEYFAGPPGDNCCHNSKLIGPEGARNDITPVPYDFDFSALVKAPYATPPEGLRVRDAHERYYRGHCRANARVPAAAAHILSKKDAMLALVANETRLSPGSRREIADFLNGSFALLADARRLDREVTSHCR